MKTITIIATAILLGSFIENGHSSGVVIYRDQSFYEPHQATLKEFTTFNQYPAHIGFKDNNHNEFELFPNNRPEVIESKTESNIDYEQTILKIKKAENTYPHLSDSLRLFEKSVNSKYEADSASRNASKAQQSFFREAHVPSNAASFSYVTQGTNYTLFLWTNNGLINIDGMSIDGEEYKNVVIESSNAGGVSIIHQDGAKNLKWKMIPNELQVVLGHDPNTKETPDAIFSLLNYLRDSTWTWGDDDEITIDGNLKIKNAKYGWTACVEKAQGYDITISLQSLGNATGRTSGVLAELHFSPDLKSYKGSNFGGKDQAWGKYISRKNLQTSTEKGSVDNYKSNPTTANSSSAAASLYILFPTQTLLGSSAVINLKQGEHYPIVGIDSKTRSENQCLIDTGYGLANASVLNQKIIVDEHSEKSKESVSITDVSNTRGVNFSTGNNIRANYKCRIISAPSGAYMIFLVCVDGKPYGQPKISNVKNSDYIDLSTYLNGVAIDSEIIGRVYFLLGGKILNIDEL